MERVITAATMTKSLLPLLLLLVAPLTPTSRKLRHFREALVKIKGRDGIPVVCGILPREWVGGMWLSRTVAVNCRLAEYCRANGWGFVDNWDQLYGRDHLC